MKKIIIWGAFFTFFFFMAVGYVYSLRQTEMENEQADLQMLAEEAVFQKQEIEQKTKMIYQYFYTKDRVTKEQIEPAPSFLQGLNREQLQSVYTGWQIVYFSPEKVILRCKIDGKSSESYIIGEYEGYLAVFYEDIQKTIHLREQTDIPLSALPEGEAKQIQEGLRVTGEENLAKVLADYMS